MSLSSLSLNTTVSGTSSSGAPSEDTNPSTSGSSSSASSEPTTPEHTSPELPPTKLSDDVEIPPFETRSFYDKALPRIPSSEFDQPSALDTHTPDHWIARDDRMLRLTGKHPFNSEAPLRVLFNQGFLTPQNLFYVRNHGYVPRVSQQQAHDWKLRVHGLVENELEFSLDDLKRLFPVVTLPVTLVCAGNRRREPNIVAKSLGFDWGAAGLSTGLFTGVLLADILQYCKPKNPLLSIYPSDTVVPGRARHVIFEGKDELPKGPYGTSQRLNWAMDRQKGMLIAWGLNGEDLSPDHGYPLRLVVPGQIGGRMVKWLQRIEVSERESQHHLHFFDNRLLPTQVSADQARSEEKWWRDPKYLINDLNVNAAICSPNHNEIVNFGLLPSDTQPLKLPITGYAYTGGGRRVTRVEVTLDDGKTWNLAEISYPEDLYRMFPIHNHPYFGTLDLSMTEMSFTWCFWKIELDVQSQLIHNDVRMIAVRAMDESLQIMPRDMYWTATSMMNSWWFRVVLHRDDNAKTLRFEHPAPVDDKDKGGWMQRMKNAGKDPRFPQFGGDSPYGSSDLPSAVEVSGNESSIAKKTEDVLQEMIDPSKKDTVITAAEYAKHSDPEGPEPWFVVHGHVYDGTGFLKDHPGGDQSIRLVAGEDATEDFMAIHSMDAKRMLRDFHMGKLESSEVVAPGSADEAPDDDPSILFLNPKKWKKTLLVQKRQISHDSRIFRFALSHPDQLLGLPVGQHVYVRVKRKVQGSDEVETVQRAYTPYSGDKQRGYLDILIKVYFPSMPNNPNATTFAGGKMTMLLENMPVGTMSDELSIELKGPVGHFTYLGDHQVQWKPSNRIRNVKKLAMIAGGSGITPIWTTLKAIADEYLALPEAERRDPIQMWVVYGNRSEEDILLREELDGLSSSLVGILHIWHVLSSRDNVSDSWKMGRGHVNVDCLREHLPPPPPPTTGDELEDTLALICGPPPMEKSVSAALTELGWDLEKTAVFF